MHIGLFFGSFNPIHIGHLFIADYMANNTSLDEVWFVVSPQNPFKAKSSLLSEFNRLHLVNLAIEGNSKLKASSIEFGLPKPSYTIDTLVYLEEKFPQHKFSLIMGSDNLKGIAKWKNSELLMEKCEIYVYERLGAEINKQDYSQNVHIEETPQISLSASYIREQLKNRKSVRYLLPESVEKYILDAGWYQAKLKKK